VFASFLKEWAGGAEVTARGYSRTMANITLIGMPGSGKSTLGALLAERLGYRFIDGDAIIESSGRPLQDIIDRDGEEEFLRIEEAELLKLAGRRRCSPREEAACYRRRRWSICASYLSLFFLDLSLALLETRLGTMPWRDEESSVSGGWISSSFTRSGDPSTSSMLTSA